MQNSFRVKASLTLTLSVFLLASGCATTAAETARGQWYAVSTPRFQVWTDGDPQLARGMVEDLERYHQVALRTTTAEDREAAPPVRIFLAKDSASMAALAPRGKLSPGVVRAGIFISTYRGNYAIVNANDEADAAGEQLTGRAVLFHEYAHYILALQGVKVPSWYNEGFAEYMSTTQFRPDGSFTVGCAPRYRTAWRSMMLWLPLAKILEADDVAALIRSASGYIRTRREPTDAYMQSWYLFHYFASDAERQRQLQKYLHLWATGTSTADAVQQAFGSTPAQLDNLIRKYADQSAIECLAIKPSEAVATPEVQMRALSASEAHFYVGDLLLNVFGPDDAAIAILHEAAPDDPGVLRSLARAHWLRAEREQGDRTAALREARYFLQQAQKLEPANPEGLTLEGHLLRLEAIEAHKRDPTKGEDELMGARKAYRKAIRSDEALGEAYYGLGLTYLVSDNRSEEAVTVLEAAAFLLPLDAEIAWSLAQLHLHRGNKEKAVPALEYVVRWGQSEQQRAKARGALDETRSSLGAAAVEPAGGKR